MCLRSEFFFSTNFKLSEASLMAKTFPAIKSQQSLNYYLLLSKFMLANSANKMQLFAGLLVPDLSFDDNARLKQAAAENEVQLVCFRLIGFPFLNCKNKIRNNKFEIVFDYFLCWNWWVIPFSHCRYYLLHLSLRGVKWKPLLMLPKVSCIL